MSEGFLDMKNLEDAKNDLHKIVSLYGGDPTHSTIYADLSPPPDVIKSVLELPIYTPSMTKLQKNDGIFYFMLDFDEIGSSEVFLL